MSKYITLSNGKQAIVDDDCSADKLKWHSTAIGYVGSRIDRKQITLHQYVLGKKPGMDIDHINGDKLDNRACNLRHVSRSVNNLNRQRASSKPSGRKGVTWDNHYQAWHVGGYLNGKKKYIGRFKDLEVALKARDKWDETVVKELVGDLR